MPSLTRRILLVAGAIIAAASLSLGVEIVLSLRSRWPFAHSGHGHVLGWFGFFLILLTYVYPWKKRYGAKGVWPKNWFTVHMVAGVLGPMLILIHSGWHLHAGVPVLALAAMIGVVVSGVVGKTIHHATVRMLSDQRHKLAEQGLTKVKIEQAVYEIAAREETFRVWQIIHAPLASIFIVLTLLHILGALYYGGL